jgi:NAD(P)H-flavin reductase
MEKDRKCATVGVNRGRAARKARQIGFCILFVAGSTGFAPIQSIIEDMLFKGIDRKMTLYWGARNRGGLYSELPATWAKQHRRFKFVPVISDER